MNLIAKDAESKINRRACTECGRVIESLEQYHATCDAVTARPWSHTIYQTHLWELQYGDALIAVPITTAQVTR